MITTVRSRASMFDYIVVGAGSAGCVLARRLSENPAVPVLLLEAGPEKVPRESRIPAAFAKLFKTRYDWNYSTAPEPGASGRSLYWPRGRMLGGSSAMTAMIWTPPARAVLDEWAAFGNPGWSWTDLVPALRRAEWPAADRRPRGRVGISVGPLGTVNPVTRALVAAARSEGIAANDGFFDGNMDGAGKVHDIDDLWVADASIMPAITAGPTNAPTVRIAERSAELIP